MPGFHDAMAAHGVNNGEAVKISSYIVAKRLMATVSSQLRTASSMHLEIRSGQLLDVSLTVSPIKDPHGRVIGASKILRDISTRKRLEQALLQAEKIAATGRMAATIAHEINNPFEAVMKLDVPSSSDDCRPGRCQLLPSQSRRNSGVSRISPSRRLVITANMQRQAVPQSGR
jgi:hypothetical protein